MTKKPHLLSTLVLSAVAGAGLVTLPVAHAQEPASIQGHATNEIGEPVKDGEVRLTNEPTVDAAKRKYQYVFKTDANGDYKGTGIAAGTYLVILFKTNVSLDFFPDQSFKAGEAKTENFDMTREEYMKSLTPERRKAIEEYKAKNAGVQAANKNIANLNATMTAIRADMKSPSPNFDKDVTDSKSAVDSKPDEGLLWVLYGDALVGKADHAAAADRQNKVNPNTDDAVKGSYTDAVTAYKKAADLAGAGGEGKKPNIDMQATIYNELGSAYAKSGSATDAVAAYDKAVSLQPTSAGVYYGNEAAVLFNAHQDQQALEAANKAIAADPSKPNPYFVVGQELLSKSTVDPKTQKILPPPGCLEAYRKYLELAPDGPQAASIKETLTAMGEKVETRYSAKKK